MTLLPLKRLLYVYSILSASTRRSISLLLDPVSVGVRWGINGEIWLTSFLLKKIEISLQKNICARYSLSYRPCRQGDAVSCKRLDSRLYLLPKSLQQVFYPAVAKFFGLRPKLKGLLYHNNIASTFHTPRRHLGLPGAVARRHPRYTRLHG